ncbi:helix-turn-helix domain-containing protein [Lichenicoccus roseus]|uniref:Helix-turn-helix transcriptional regulator n=1 Tax=Lichenicoccus roseus TaxID=2683649 RepID=A0A5R9J254_9PROT|nr:helix-turn-helix transcriptional regulator [Lichenicoccus roseus]TLU71039.1 helix-turn-helix transcriptional regulator [Lichenicoccus roseus]
MRLNEIGQQLRAYRLESGMRAEEIAARLGVSRAALYRYEKGEVIKLDTVQRLAELLKISPLSLLGIGVEYYSRTIGFFERMRQLEETADQILQVGEPLAYLVTSDEYDALLAQVFAEMAEQSGAEAPTTRALSEQVLGIMAARKRAYQLRRPNLITIIAEPVLQRFLEQGVADSMRVSPTLRAYCRRIAAAEVQNIAAMLETEPMGLQFSLIPGAEPTTSCTLLRQRDRASLAINPFRSDASCVNANGVALVTSAPEAVSSHQRVAETMWRDSLKGATAARRVRELLAAHAVQ